MSLLHSLKRFNEDEQLVHVAMDGNDGFDGRQSDARPNHQQKEEETQETEPGSDSRFGRLPGARGCPSGTDAEEEHISVEKAFRCSSHITLSFFAPIAAFRRRASKKYLVDSGLLTFDI